MGTATQTSSSQPFSGLRQQARKVGKMAKENLSRRESFLDETSFKPKLFNNDIDKEYASQSEWESDDGDAKGRKSSSNKGGRSKGKQRASEDDDDSQYQSEGNQSRRTSRGGSDEEGRDRDRDRDHYHHRGRSKSQYQAKENSSNYREHRQSQRREDYDDVEEGEYRRRHASRGRQTPNSDYRNDPQNQSRRADDRYYDDMLRRDDLYAQEQYNRYYDDMLRRDDLYAQEQYNRYRNETEEDQRRGYYPKRRPDYENGVGTRALPTSETYDRNDNRYARGIDSGAIRHDREIRSYDNPVERGYYYQFRRSLSRGVDRVSRFLSGKSQVEPIRTNEYGMRDDNVDYSTGNIQSLRDNNPYLGINSKLYNSYYSHDDEPNPEFRRKKLLASVAGAGLGLLIAKRTMWAVGSWSKMAALMMLTTAFTGKVEKWYHKRAMKKKIAKGQQGLEVGPLPTAPVTKTGRPFWRKAKLDSEMK